ncbi:MAG: glycosyltransferase, partial [Desulfovibrionaceae bacterium]|nr:glycosyltransferase [Desulfovibrionaceae bacterium]
MNILFVHNNFPGQFHRLAVELAADPANKVLFLSHYIRKDVSAPRVVWRQVPLAAGEENPNRPRKKYLTILARGERFADAMVALGREGFKPDVIYGHVGFGCCVYAPDIFPQAALMGYFEWFYSSQADVRFFAGGKPVSLTTKAENRQSNMCTLSALQECVLGIAPTRWQFAQHPPEFAHKLHVLHDGVDTQFFSPQKTRGVKLTSLDLSHAEEIITYATRGLEPYRGFHTFYRCLPAVLEARPKAHVVIMADDRTSYGNKRKDGRTWKEFMRDEVKVDDSRVHFIPFQPYDQYRALLRASDVHVYLTAPFVLSWSMLEAMSCGCLLVASDTEPVREVLQDGVNGFLADFWQPAAFARRIIHCLEQREKLGHIRANARQTVLDRYALHTLLPRHAALVRAACELGRATL